MFLTPAFAQAAGGASTTDFLGSLLPLVAIVVVMYFLLIRPQQKRAKAHREMIGAVRKGDRIVTAGGVFGKVIKIVDDEEVEVEIAKGVNIRVLRHTIGEVRVKSEPVRGSSSDDEKPAKADRKSKSKGKKETKDSDTKSKAKNKKEKPEPSEAESE